MKTTQKRPISTTSSPGNKQVGRQDTRAFTLLELLVVIAIMVLVMALLAPAFTSINAGNAFNSAASTVADALRTARAHAISKNTYVWVGFYEEDGAKPSTNPATPGIGRLVLSIVASKDGTNIYGSATGAIDATRLTQTTKLIKVDSLHLPLLAVGSGTGDTFDSRPAPQSDLTAGYNYSRFGELNAATPNTAPYTTPYEFQYPVGSPPTVQYVFKQLLQFSPRGEARVNGNSYQVRRIVEVGLLPARANSIPAATSGAGTSTVTYPGNVAAIQISGFAGAVKIYRR